MDEPLHVPVSLLRPGQKGTVICLHGTAALRQHLLEMGFTKGTTVEFVRQAPLGDPIDLRLRGYRLSLRRQEAAAVMVVPSAEEAPEKGLRRRRSRSAQERGNE